MNRNLVEELEFELDRQIHMRDMYASELKKVKEYEGYNLRVSKKPSGSYYYVTEAKHSRVEGVGRGEKQREEGYIGRDDKPIVKGVQQYKFYEKAVRIADNNIKTIEYLLSRYEGVNPESIRKKLSGCYRGAEVTIRSMNTKSSEVWLAEMKAIKDSVKPFRPHELKHTALDGTMMRSKSELLIAEYLIMHGIPFIYELPVQTELGQLFPDFTIYDERTGNVYFWEHWGMLYDEGYYSDQFIKLKKYASEGYTPGVNLIITVDDINGNFNTKTVDRIVKSFLGSAA